MDLQEENKKKNKDKLLSGHKMVRIMYTAYNTEGARPDNILKLLYTNLYSREKKRDAFYILIGAIV